MFYEKFWYPSILQPLWYVLAFKIPCFENGVPNLTKGTLKHLTKWYESIFESTNFPVCKLVFLANTAAFLALMALKFKTIKFVNKWYLTVQLIQKKYKILALLTLWPLFGLYNLCWPFSFFLKSLTPKKTRGMLESCVWFV